MDIIAIRDYTLTPGPPLIKDGLFSGEWFLSILLPKFKQVYDKNQKLLIDFDGVTYGYSSGFLSAVFTELGKKFGYYAVKRTLKFKSDDEPELITEIKHYLYFSYDLI